MVLVRNSTQFGTSCVAVQGILVVHESIKEDARRLIERLPADATWEDLQYEIYVRQSIDAGLRDSREGRIVPLDAVRAELLPKAQ
jgi:hypothetical protein